MCIFVYKSICVRLCVWWVCACSCIFRYIFFVGIHSMQHWTATKRHELTGKRSTKRLRHTGILFRKPTLKKISFVFNLIKRLNQKASRKCCSWRLTKLTVSPSPQTPSQKFYFDRCSTKKLLEHMTQEGSKRGTTDTLRKLY